VATIPSSISWRVTGLWSQKFGSTSLGPTASSHTLYVTCPRGSSASAENQLTPSPWGAPKSTSSWAHLASQDLFLANIMWSVLVDCCSVIVVCNKI
jgi:hypothetical protein